MKKHIVRLCFLMVLASALIPPAFALDPFTSEKKWNIDYSRSKLSFSGMLGDNTTFQGAFKNFNIDVDFDPQTLEKGKITVTVDIASVTTNDVQRDGMLPQSEWFETGKYPRAKFVSQRITEAGNDENGNKVYKAEGQLTLKGIAQKVSIPFILTKEGDHWRIQGKTRISRSDFLVGTGQFADENSVKNVVNVMIDLVANPNN